jgi:hypothetical protein
MKKIKKWMIAGLLSALSLSALNANDFFVSVAPLYSLENGHVNEYVYNKNDKTVSEFLWDRNALSYLGFNVQGGWRFINLDASCVWGIPKECGGMENSTWMSSYNPTLKNRYFEYENKLEDYFDLDTRVKFDIPVIQGWFNIVPYAGFGLTRYTMYADNSWGGQGVTENYAWNDQNNQARSYSKGKLHNEVRFTREIYDLFCGADLKGTLFDRVYVTLGANVSPFIWVNALQHNYVQNGRYYLDMIHGFFKSWNFEGSVEAKIWQGLSAGAGFSYSILNLMTGDAYSSNYSDSGFEKNTDGSYCGTESSSWKITLFARYRFDFGPTHTPRVHEPKEPRERKEKTPKVRNGKVDVRQY